MKTDAWADILDEGETIIWQGRPSGGFHFRPRKLATMLFGLAFAGFALFWMIMVALSGGFFWMFGLIHFTVGIGIICGPVLWPAYMAKRTWYTLTDTRGIIATTSIFGQKNLKSYPINKDTKIEQVTHDFDLGTIYFAEEMRRRSKGRSRTVSIGFENIPDAVSVQRLIRDIQKAAS